MRYSPREGATIYRGGVTSVRLEQDSAPKQLPPGTAADDSKGGSKPGAKSKGSGFGSAGSRTVAQAAMAADAARSTLAALSPETVRVFTDGGCKGNPGPAGSGARVELPDGRVGEACRSLGVATNNVGELSAIDLALDLLDEGGVALDAPVALFTDSQYSHGVLVQGWKAKANREVILPLRERLALRTGLKMHWVAGHVGIAGNERADQLADSGVAGLDLKRWI
jgi:ribonuclease HI